MARYDFRSPRVFVDQPLQEGGSIALDQPQAHYLRDVLRLKPGDRVLVFNGREGEWQGGIDAGGKRTLVVRLEAQTRPQEGGGDLHYLFAPLKRARLDYMVQKAVEMGVARLVPVITRHTQAERVNAARMRANAIEAAEQCGVLRLPGIAEPVALAEALGALAPERVLIFCDEDAPIADPGAALAAAAGAKAPATAPAKAPTLALAVLVGPECGFAAEEREMLLSRRNIVRLALGPRILRADTAAVAALALVQAVLGDWRGGA